MDYFFDTPRPRVFAHRGLAQHADLDENTIAAFLAAIEHGATHLESDTQATKDGHAVLFHDDDLFRVAGISERISELTLSEVRAIPLKFGGQIPTFEEALEQLPGARFNIDVKTEAAISPTISAIESQGAHDRVLLSSFANPIRKRALAQLSKPTATSASQSTVIAAYLSHRLLFGLGFGSIVKNVHAFQIPDRKGPVNFASRSFIRRLQAHSTEVHFWTINDPEHAQKLVNLGADGIVSDRVDLLNLR